MRDSVSTYLANSVGWDPTSRFGDQSPGAAPSRLLSETSRLYKTIFEYNGKIASSMLDILGTLGNARLAVNKEIMRDVRSLIDMLHELRCGDIDNARADALTNEVIERALQLVEDLQAALNPRGMSAGAS